jgi:signal transduction histidine kinase
MRAFSVLAMNRTVGPPLQHLIRGITLITGRRDRLAGLGALDDLVMAVSTQLLGRGPDELGPTIRSALERLAGLVGADRGYVVKLNIEGRSLGDAYEEWWADGVEQRAVPIAELDREAQRFYFRSLRDGAVIRADDVEELDARAPEAAAALRSDGVRSILLLPLVAQDTSVGFVGFEGRRRSIVWDDATVSRMRIVGELVVAAVERCQGDIERVAIAGALAARNEELERSNRELQQFASVVSHDLLQPLSVIHGFVGQLVRIGVEHPTKADLAKSCGEAATRATTRMRALIDDVLAVARAGAPVSAFELVDLGQVVGDVVADLDDEIAAARATVVVEPLPAVEGSPTRLRQLFQNLLANAIKFHPVDRAPTVHVTVEGGDPTRCVVRVADDGIGIPPEDRASVFEMFTRSEGIPTSGSGIGLAICARVVAAHGGTIALGDRDGGGCVVIVDLPRRQPQLAP